MTVKYLPLLFLLPLLLACERSGQSTSAAEANERPAEAVMGSAKAGTPAAPKRWYSASQVEAGRVLFAEHCAVCHGAQAEATPDWNKRLPDGHYPPPPLNGSAHAWHHPLRALARTIDMGGVPLGGTMPAFGDKLNDQEKLAVIAFFQHYWDDRIYQAWLDRGGLK